jgi:hypothetical protein
MTEAEGRRANLKGEGGWLDLPEVPGSNERAEGSHLPQAAKMEVSEVRKNSDATAELTSCGRIEAALRALSGSLFLRRSGKLSLAPDISMALLASVAV